MVRISAGEMIIMDYLWREEAKKEKEMEKMVGKDFRAILEVYEGRVAKQTVNTYLSRLLHKGFLESEGEPGKKLYRPSLSRMDYAWRFLDDLYQGLDRKRVLRDLKG